MSSACKRHIDTDFLLTEEQKNKKTKKNKKQTRKQNSRKNNQSILKP